MSKVQSEAKVKLQEYLNGESDIFNKALFETIFCANAKDLKNLEIEFSNEVQAVQEYKSKQEYLNKFGHFYYD